MNNKLSARESLAIDALKAFAILSVIAAHTVLLDMSSDFSSIVTGIWSVFRVVGVPVFLIVGGFLYSRRDGDSKVFWKKKFFRIFLPWVLCSAITYVIGIVGGNTPSIYGYIKWVLGFGTWYYYIIVYLLFLILFKYIYMNNIALIFTLVIQLVALTINTFQIPIGLENIAYEWYYLNPLFWIGYFSLGILIRRYRTDVKLRSKLSLIVALLVMLVASAIKYIYGIYTYFSLITMINCLAIAVVLWNLSYFIAKTKISSFVRTIGVSTYCIYLLHMQIVQTAVGLLPACGITYLFAPFIGLTIMMIIIYIANWFCDKLPFGDKLKMSFGL